MPLAKLIHDHIDKQDEIEERVQDKIDKIYSKIDIDTILDDPEQAMIEIVNVIKNEIEAEGHNAIQNGIDFGERITKRDEIEIVETQDPTLNKELFDDTRQG